MEIELKIFRDGDQICVLWGENLQVGIVGFGENIPEAVRNFADNWELIRGNENAC